MTQDNIKDFNKTNDGFMVSGRIVPTYANNIWTFTEEIFVDPYFKKYDDDEMDLRYIEEVEKAVFFYYIENNCVGQIKMCSNWNGYALIEDIAVAKDYRKKGVGTALLNKAIEWAKERSFCGVTL